MSSMHGKGVLRRSVIGQSKMKCGDEQMQSLREKKSPCSPQPIKGRQGTWRSVPPMKTLFRLQIKLTPRLSPKPVRISGACRKEIDYSKHLVVKAIIIASISESTSSSICVSSRLTCLRELEECTWAGTLHALSEGFVSADLNIADGSSS